MAAPAGIQVDNPQMLQDLEVEMMSDMFKRFKRCHGPCENGGPGHHKDRNTVKGLVTYSKSNTKEHVCRMSAACQLKCIPRNYKEPELSKGESVCLDRCVAKYLDIHERLGKKMASMSQPQG